MVHSNAFAHRRIAGFFFIFCLLSARVVHGQTTRSSPALEEQVRLLREELIALRQEVSTLRAEMRPASAAVIPSNDAAIPSAEGVAQSQIAELAQTKVESSSRMPVKIYGTILSSTFFNTRAVNWLDQPNLVRIPAGGASATGTFGSSLRQSRLGLVVDGPTVGKFATTGMFAVDFNGGSTDFRSSPLLGLANIVYAYARFDSPRLAFEAGQDESILAPLNPTSLVSLSLPSMYRTGNLYLRAPQVRVEQKLGGGQSGQWKAVLGLIAPTGLYQVSTSAVAGPGYSDSPSWQRPALQGRLSWQSAAAAPGEKAAFEAGLSGHYGRVGLGSFSASSWAGAFDVNLTYHRMGFGAEGYSGNNLGSFGGGIGQLGRTMGGFVESRFQASSRLRFNSGFGTDHLTKFYFAPAGINTNSAAYANTIVQLTPEIATSFEYRYMFTKPVGSTVLPNQHLNFGVAYSF